MRAGRAFLRRLINLWTTAKQLNHFVRLTAKSDIEWWHHFCASWNGTSMMFMVNRTKPECDMSIVSDASGSWGCGAIFGPNWFQLRWAGLGSTRDQNITVKELFPIVVAAAVWGPLWAGKTIRAQCDNMAAVAMVNTHSGRESEVMHLLRCLAFLEAKHSFYIFATHIPGAKKRVSRCLSRDNQVLFHFLYPPGTQRAGHNPNLAIRCTRYHQTRLDITSLDTAVEQFFKHDLAESTQRTYAAAKRRYLHFCNL